MQMKRDTNIKSLKNRNCYRTVFSITAISLQYEFLSPLNRRDVWRIPCTDGNVVFNHRFYKIFYPWKRNHLCLEFIYSYAKYICNYKRCLVLEVYGRFLRVSLLVLVNILCLKRGKKRVDWFENLFHHNSLFCRLQLKEKLFN